MMPDDARWKDEQLGQLINDYHAHLDVCRQCRVEMWRPCATGWLPCATGRELMQKIVVRANELGIEPAKWVTR